MSLLLTKPTKWRWFNFGGRLVLPGHPHARARRHMIRLVCFLPAVLITTAAVVSADNPRVPVAFQRSVQPFDRVDRFAPYPPDMDEVMRQDRQRPGGPYRFAVRRPVDITPGEYGTWERLDDGMLLWRLELTSPGAISLNLGFSEFFMPASGRCFVYSLDGQSVLGPFTEQQNRPHGRLYTPILGSDDIVLELNVHESEAALVRLRLEAVNHGYRDMEGTPKGYTSGVSGACNVNVACTDGDPWRDEVRAAAMYQISGSYGSITCTGTLVNNTAQNDKPYFLTAFHCFDEVDGHSDCTISGTSAIAASIIVYWNYQAATCSGTTGSKSLYQAGSVYRAGYCNSDFALLELDEVPVSAANVFYAGWDRGSAAPGSAATIHHPSGDIKKISVESHPLTVTSFGGTPSPGDGTHLRVADWDVGTTESGSSGCPLFNSAGRIVGQLHGGDAACYNNLPDWFGRFYTSWSGGGTAATRLRDWLDPIASGVSAIDGKDADLAVDAYEPDDTFAAAATIAPGVPQSRSIIPPGDVDWARFTVDVVSEAVIKTTGADGDTRMWLYDENLVQLAFNDDFDGSRFSRIERRCGGGALMPGTYYIKVDEYGGNDEIAAYELHLDLSPFSAADLTGDCRVDFADLSVLAGQWLTCSRAAYQRIVPQDAVAGEYFGRAVGLSGDTALIGKPYDSRTATFAGSAYVFVRNGASWVQQARLVNPNPAEYDFFGFAVAVDGDYAVIGARGEDDLGSSSGAAFVYKRDGSTWTRQTKLLAPDGAPGDYFGYAVDISGDVVAVGAPYDNGSGSAYVYVRNGATWQFKAKLIASDGASDDNFGRAIAIDGACLVAGVYHDDDRGTDSGSAWVFVYDDLTGAWSPWVKLTAADGQVGAAFGTSVAVDGDRVAIGAPQGDGRSAGAGCAYVFERQEMGFAQLPKLTAPDGVQDDAFGVSVAVDGGLVLVGANAHAGSGAAYLFRQEGSQWRLHSTLNDAGASGGEEFGCAVAVAGRTAVVGAYGDSVESISAGAAHLFDLTTTTADLNGDDCVDTSDLLEMANRWLDTAF